MTETKFLAAGNDIEEANLFTCELVSRFLLEKKGLKNEFIDIRCLSLEDAKNLDELMWGFPKDLFIPHNLIHEEDKKSNINIGYPECKFKPGKEKLLININPDLPKEVSKYQYFYQLVIEDASNLRERAAETWIKCNQRGMNPTFQRN